MKELQKKIDKLSIPEKIVLVENIWDSIAESHYSALTEKQKAELNKRLALIKAGKAEFTTVAEIKAKYKTLK